MNQFFSSPSPFLYFIIICFFVISYVFLKPITAVDRRAAIFGVKFALIWYIISFFLRDFIPASSYANFFLAPSLQNTTT